MKKENKWVKTELLINGISGQIYKPKALIYGGTSFAVHKSLGNYWGWSVTHVPTGCKFLTARTQFLAKEATEKWCAFGVKIKKEYEKK